MNLSFRQHCASQVENWSTPVQWILILQRCGIKPIVFKYSHYATEGIYHPDSNLVMASCRKYIGKNSTVYKYKEEPISENVNPGLNFYLSGKYG